jgi:uncharacterized protein (TIGR02453 family)
MTTFTGFQPSAFGFLRDLGDHNDRAWFREHQDVYKEHLLEPARAFVVAMGERLAARSPAIHADPRVNGSILRIARDTRFSADPTPYRTHMALWFWEGDGPSRECAGYFMRLDPDAVVLGVGMHHFTDRVLHEYRRAVDSDDRGAELERALRAAARAGAQIGRAQWKRVPAPYPADHPRADLLRLGGLVAAITVPLPAEAHGRGFPAWCATRWKPLAPLQAWVAGVAAAAG